MAATCFDNSVWEDLRFRALPTALRAAFPAVVARIDTYGDGALSDRELALGLLEPKALSELAAALEQMGWVTRTAEGRLRRTGLLKPVSADALRMRARRARQASPAEPTAGIEDEKAKAGRAPTAVAEEHNPAGPGEGGESAAAEEKQAAARVEAGQVASRAHWRTITEQLPNDLRGGSERQAGQRAGLAGDAAGFLARARAACASESESESDQTDLTPYGGSDLSLIRTVRTSPRSRRIPAEDAAPRSGVFDTLRREGCSEAMLAEAARRVGEQNLWKENYVRAVVANLAAGR